MNIGTKLVAPEGRLIVQEIEVENKTKGGLLIAEKTSDVENKAKLGKVISSGVKKGEHTVLEGATIYYSKFGGVFLKHEGDEYRSLTVSDVVGYLV